METSPTIDEKIDEVTKPHTLFDMGVQALQRRYHLTYIRASKLHNDLEEMARAGREAVDAIRERFRTGEPSMKTVYAVAGLSEIFGYSEETPPKELSQTQTEPCDCQDFEHGLVSNECPVHNQSFLQQ